MLKTWRNLTRRERIYGVLALALLCVAADGGPVCGVPEVGESEEEEYYPVELDEDILVGLEAGGTLAGQDCFEVSLTGTTALCEGEDGLMGANLPDTQMFPICTNCTGFSPIAFSCGGATVALHVEAAPGAPGAFAGVAYDITDPEAIIKTVIGAGTSHSAFIDLNDCSMTYALYNANGGPGQLDFFEGPLSTGPQNWEETGQYALEGAGRGFFQDFFSGAPRWQIEPGSDDTVVLLRSENFQGLSLVGISQLDQSFQAVSELLMHSGSQYRAPNPLVETAFQRVGDNLYRAAFFSASGGLIDSTADLATGSSRFRGVDQVAREELGGPPILAYTLVPGCRDGLALLYTNAGPTPQGFPQSLSPQHANEPQSPWLAVSCLLGTSVGSTYQPGPKISAGGSINTVPLGFPPIFAADDASPTLLFNAAEEVVLLGTSAGNIDVLQWRVLTRLIFPQFGKGQGLFSQISLVNTDLEESASAELFFRTQQGGPLSFDRNGSSLTIPGSGVPGSFQIEIPAGGRATFQTNADGELAVGSVVVESNRPLEGAIVFGGAFGLAGVAASDPGPGGFTAPVETSGAGIDTGIAVTSLSDSPVQLQAQLCDEEGNVLATAQNIAPLAAQGQFALFVTQLDWDTNIDFNSFVGVLKVTADGPTAATVLLTRPGQFASLPVRAQ